MGLVQRGQGMELVLVFVMYLWKFICTGCLGRKPCLLGGPLSASHVSMAKACILNASIKETFGRILSNMSLIQKLGRFADRDRSLMQIIFKVDMRY